MKRRPPGITIGAAASLAAVLALVAILAVPGTGGHGPARGRGVSAAFTAGPSYRLHPGSITQTEPLVARHPLDESVLFAAANTIDLSTGFISEGVYASTDGGATWTGSDTCNGAPILFHRGDPGVAIDRNGTFILTRLGFSPGLYSHSSTDLGATWSGQRRIAANDQDRADLATDGDPASPRYGTTYAAWVRFSPPFPVLFASTTDGGAGWSDSAQVNVPIQRSQGADIEVGPGGILYVCWAGVGSTSPFTEDFVGFARSVDGGASWEVTENAFDINGIQGTLPSKGNIRVNGLPRLAVDPHDAGRLYIVTTEKNLSPAGSDPDIILRASSDSGRSWSAAVRVNRDPPDNGKVQYFPAVAIDRWGELNILYYSDEATTADSAGVHLARTLGGHTGSWETAEIADHRFLPQPIGGLGAGYQGDNIAIVATGDFLRPVWADNSSGVYQLWTCAVEVPADPVPVGYRPALPAGFALDQNFPNPFNPSTSIAFTIPDREFVTLTVHDVTGGTVAVVVSSRLPAGSHSAEFTTAGKGLGSGIYFCRLQAGARSAVRKMLLVR